MPVNVGFADERKAIETRFSDAWGATTPIKYENVPTAEPLTAPWVALSIFPGEGFQVSLGDNPLHRFVGVIVVRILVPEAQGLATAEAYADQAAAVFLDSTTGKPVSFASGSGGLIHCRTPKKELAGPTGGFFMYNVSVPFIRNQNFV